MLLNPTTREIQGEHTVKLLRPHRHSALLLILPLLSSPAWAASYGENMHLEEYIVGLAALVLVVWDITRRYMPRPGDAPVAVSSPEGRDSLYAKLRDSDAWMRIREVALDHPFEASVLVCGFALLVFARVPFSLSAALVGTIAWFSLVLGARLASQPPIIRPVAVAPVKPAEAPVAAPLAAAPKPYRRSLPVPSRRALRPTQRPKPPRRPHAAGALVMPRRHGPPPAVVVPRSPRPEPFAPRRLAASWRSPMAAPPPWGRHPLPGLSVRHHPA